MTEGRWENRPTRSNGKQDIKSDVANQIGIKPGGNVTGGQKESLPGEKHIMSNIKETLQSAKTSKVFTKVRLLRGSKIQALPQSQSPGQVLQGNKHLPQNLTEKFKAKSKSQNWNSSAGSQGAVKHHPYEKPRSN